MHGVVVNEADIVEICFSPSNNRFEHFIRCLRLKL